jgi:hypothetical protein
MKIFRNKDRISESLKDDIATVIIIILILAILFVLFK